MLHFHPKSETVEWYVFRFDQLRAAFEAELFKRCATGDTVMASDVETQRNGGCATCGPAKGRFRFVTRQHFVRLFGDSCNRY